MNCGWSGIFSLDLFPKLVVDSCPSVTLLDQIGVGNLTNQARFRTTWMSQVQRRHSLTNIQFSLLCHCTAQCLTTVQIGVFYCCSLHVILGIIFCRFRCVLWTRDLPESKIQRTWRALNVYIKQWFDPFKGKTKCLLEVLAPFKRHVYYGLDGITLIWWSSKNYLEVCRGPEGALRHSVGLRWKKVVSSLDCH